jgi:peptidoglycan/LPS O-acetylase OafA/YrhL
VKPDPARPPGRLESVEVLRGFAALAVVLFHLTRRPEMLPGSWIKACANYGYLGVEAFFVISGLVIPIALAAEAERGKSAFSFLGRRFLRLYPPFFISLLMAWGLNQFQPGWRQVHPGAAPHTTAGMFLSNMLLCSDFTGAGWINPVYWTLAVEFQFYILMAFGFSSFRNCRPRMQVAVVLAVAFLSLPFRAHGLLLGYLPLFGAGLALWLFLSGRIGGWTTAMMVVVQSLAVFFHFGGAAALTLMASALVCLARLPELLRRFVWLGTISYSLYLVHVPVGSRVVNAGLRFLPTGPVRLALLAAALAACFFLAWIFYLVFERPCLEYVRMRTRSRPPAVKN